MIKRIALLLSVVGLTILFVMPAHAVTLPNICSQGKWVGCGNNAYYCTAIKGDSCKMPTFVVTRPLENWTKKQQTATKVKPGAAVKSASSYRYVRKYVNKKVCKYNSKGVRYCRYQRVLTWVAVKK